LQNFAYLGGRGCSAGFACTRHDRLDTLASFLALLFLTLKTLGNFDALLFSFLFGLLFGLLAFNALSFFILSPALLLLLTLLCFLWIKWD